MSLVQDRPAQVEPCLIMAMLCVRDVGNIHYTITARILEAVIVRTRSSGQGKHERCVDREQQC